MDVAAIKRFLLTTRFLVSQFNDDGFNFEQISKLLRLEIHAANSEVFRASSYGDKYYLILRGSIEINAPSKKLINGKSLSLKDDMRLKLLLKHRESTNQSSSYILPSTSTNVPPGCSAIVETTISTELPQKLHQKQPCKQGQKECQPLENTIRIVIKPSHDSFETIETNQQNTGNRHTTQLKDRIDGYNDDDLNSNKLSQQSIHSRRQNQQQKHEKHNLSSQNSYEGESETLSKSAATPAKAILQVGQEFGESAMISSYPRSYTAKTIQSTSSQPSSTDARSGSEQSDAVLLAVLTKHQFSQVLRRSQLRHLHAELDILRNSYVLRTWTDHMLKDLFLSSQVLNISSEQCVYKQFDTADSIFIILKGVFQVSNSSLISFYKINKCS